MRKLISITISALCLLAFSCKNENQTNTVPTGTETATALVRGPVAPAGPKATELTVDFIGMVSFILGNGKERAVLPRIAHHHLQIIFPLSMKTQVESTFKGVKCTLECIVPFDGRAFRIVDSSGNPPAAAFAPSGSFSTVVTHLKQVPLPAQVADTFQDMNIEKDVFDNPKKNSFIGGFFELAGGSGDVTPFSCTAHFQGQASSQSFPKFVTITYQLPAGTKLQLFEGGSAGWADFVTLTDLSAPLGFVVDNNMPGKMSHFDEYALLSTKRVNGKPVDLPDVIADTANCTLGAGDVPGCSDSQWP